MAEELPGGKKVQPGQFPSQGGMTKEELDERNVGTRQLAGSSVEIVTDSGPEREQSVAVRSLPYLHETPEQFRQRIENEED